MIKRLLARIGSFFKGVFLYAKRHRIQAGAFILVIALLGYWGYTTYTKSVTTTQYVLAPVHFAPIEETVTGSGQVASEHELNLSPKASGTLTSVTVKAGDTVTAGEVIATVDSTDAQKALRDAAANLEGARITYEQSLTSNTDTVQKSRDAVFASSASVYSDISTTLSGINAIMQGKEVSGSYSVDNLYAYSQLSDNNATIVAYRDKLVAAYNAAESAYQATFRSYNQLNPNADPATVLSAATDTYTTAQTVALAAKDLNVYLNAVLLSLGTNNPKEPTILPTHITSSLSYINTINADVSSSLSAKNDLSSSLQSSSGGAATLSEQSAQLTYQKAQNAYRDAQDTLEQYVVRAPFAGTIASVPLQKFDQAGSATTVAVLVTKQQLASLSLNEVDAAKVKAGQTVTLTFDAIPDLTVNGTVAEVDTVGTVSSGVVSYTVKIGFDTQDPRILPGMTVNATIITAAKDTALVVPSSAIKTQGTESYVEVATFNTGAGPSFGQASSTQHFRNASSTPDASTTRAFNGATTTGFAGGRTGAGLTVDTGSVTVRRVTVTTGIVSDTMTEVTSGLAPGEFVVSSSLNASGKTTTTQSRSIFSLFGGGGAARTGTAGSGATRTSGNASSVARPPGG